MHDFKVSRWFQGWTDKHEKSRAFSLCSATCSKSDCGAETCVGCGQKPRTGQFTGDYKGLKLDWCCENGRLFAFWVALCKYDELELQQQMDSTAKLAAHTARGPSGSNGTGYVTLTAKNVSWGALAMASSSDPFVGGWSGGQMSRGRGAKHTLNFQQADEKTDPMIALILGLIIELLPNLDEGSKKRIPKALRAMIQLSLLMDKVADMLRNDSLRDVSKRSEVYQLVLDFVNRLGSRSKTMYLVCDQRYFKKRSSGLQILSASESFTNSRSDDLPLVLGTSSDDMVPSVVGCMAKLALQAKQLSEQANSNRSIQSEFGSDVGKLMLQMASKINKLYSSLASSSYEKRESKQQTDNASLWDSYHERHRMDRDPTIPQHLCASASAAAQSVVSSIPGRMRRIISEQVEMTTGLPQYVFVKAHDSLPHIMKCLIVGPDDTPYEGGLFE